MPKIIADKVFNENITHNKYPACSGGFPWSEYEADEGLNTYAQQAARTHARDADLMEPIRSIKVFENFDLVRARHPVSGEMFDAIVLQSEKKDNGEVFYQVEAFDDNVKVFITKFCFLPLN